MMISIGLGKMNLSDFTEWNLRERKKLGNRHVVIQLKYKFYLLEEK